jgi:hypothetical protein
VSNAPQIFICIDTNILVRIASQGKPGCELTHWEAIRAAVSDGHATLIVPEVVLLEFEKLRDTVPAAVQSCVNDVKKTIEKHEYHSEANELRGTMLASADSFRVELLDAYHRRCDEIAEYLSANGKVIELTPELLFQAKRRLIAGRIPQTENKQVKRDKNSDNDCCIVESLVVFFNLEKREHAQLLFCTENYPDFAVKLDSGRYAFHQKVKEGLPLAEVFIDLKSLSDCLESIVAEKGKVVEPTAQEVKEAGEREAMTQNELLTLLHRLQEVVGSGEMSSAIPDFIRIINICLANSPVDSSPESTYATLMRVKESMQRMEVGYGMLDEMRGLKDRAFELKEKIVTIFDGITHGLAVGGTPQPETGHPPILPPAPSPD